jgi:Cdc6-like AAA superfamily ATPase
MGIFDLKFDTSTIVDTTFVIKNDTTALRDETAVQHKKDLLKWICPVDYYEQHRDLIARHQTGTGQWFLQDGKFQEWLWSDNATLLCPGIPGAGKTIMAALVIDHLLRTRHMAHDPVVFIYCNYKRQDEQTAKHMLSSMLRQIVDIQPGVPAVVQDFFASHNTKRTTPSGDEIKLFFEKIATRVQGITIVVDALDECEARARDNLLPIISILRQRCTVRLLATSRFLPTIEAHPTFTEKPTLEVKATDEDLENYVRSRASELHRRIASKSDLLNNLVRGIVDATGGMYVLQIR